MLTPASQRWCPVKNLNPPTIEKRKWGSESESDVEHDKADSSKTKSMLGKELESSHWKRGNSMELVEHGHADTSKSKTVLCKKMESSNYRKQKVRWWKWGRVWPGKCQPGRVDALQRTGILRLNIKEKSDVVVLHFRNKPVCLAFLQSPSKNFSFLSAVAFSVGMPLRASAKAECWEWSTRNINTFLISDWWIFIMKGTWKLGNF